MKMTHAKAAAGLFLLSIAAAYIAHVAPSSTTSKQCGSVSSIELFFVLAEIASFIGSIVCSVFAVSDWIDE